MRTPNPRRRTPAVMLVSALLALAMAGCQSDDESPTLDPEGSGAPLFDQGVDPAESQADLDD